MPESAQDTFLCVVNGLDIDIDIEGLSTTYCRSNSDDVKDRLERFPAWTAVQSECGNKWCTR
jgi:hypothetical protein